MELNNTPSNYWFNMHEELKSLSKASREIRVTAEREINQLVSDLVYEAYMTGIKDAIESIRIDIEEIDLTDANANALGVKMLALKACK